MPFEERLAQNLHSFHSSPAVVSAETWYCNSLLFIQDRVYHQRGNTTGKYEHTTRSTPFSSGT
jgi:hypothetical protein